MARQALAAARGTAGGGWAVPKRLLPGLVAGALLSAAGGSVWCFSCGWGRGSVCVEGVRVCVWGLGGGRRCCVVRSRFACLCVSRLVLSYCNYFSRKKKIALTGLRISCGQRCG